MIENNTSRDDVPEYLGDRARIYYEMEQYENVINDITVIEGYKEIDDDMEMLKWKASVHLAIHNIREQLKKSVVVKKNNERRLEFLQRINGENIFKLIEDNSKTSACKRKRY